MPCSQPGVLFFTAAALPPAIAGGGWFVFAWFVGVVLVALNWIVARATKISVFSNRCEYESGLFSKHRSTVDVKDILNIQIGQTFSERLLGIGTVGISSSGQAGFEMELSSAPRIHAMKQLVDQAKRGGNPVSPARTLPFDFGPAVIILTAAFAAFISFAITVATRGVRKPRTGVKPSGPRWHLKRSSTPRSHPRMGRSRGNGSAIGCTMKS